MIVKARSSAERDALNKLSGQILDELNVKQLDCTSEELTENEKLSVSVEGDYQVGVVTELTPELIDEGLAREIVRRLQTMRRSAGLEIADHIETYFHSPEQVDKVFVNFSDYIKQETLSTVLAKGIPADKTFSEKFKISGLEIVLAIRKR